MYQCKKCGIKASSKCVHQRSVFIRDDRAMPMFAALENILYPNDYKVVETRDDGSENVEVTFNITLYPDMDTMDKPGATARLFQMIRSLPDFDAKAICCQHEWEAMDVCVFGCCHPPETE